MYLKVAEILILAFVVIFTLEAILLLRFFLKARSSFKSFISSAKESAQDLDIIKDEAKFGFLTILSKLLKKWKRKEES